MKKNIYFFAIIIGIILGMVVENHLLAKAQALWGTDFMFWDQPYNWSGYTNNWYNRDGYTNNSDEYTYEYQSPSIYNPVVSFNWGINAGDEYTYGYQAPPIYNSFVPFSSPWALDPGYFPPGWGTEGPGGTGIYSPVYGTGGGGAYPRPEPKPLPPGWRWDTKSWEPVLVPPWYDENSTNLRDIIESARGYPGL